MYRGKTNSKYFFLNAWRGINCYGKVAKVVYCNIRGGKYVNYNVCISSLYSVVY